MARARRRAPRRRPQRRPARRSLPDSAALRGIKQGVGRAVARAFGGTVPRRRRAGRRRGGGRMAGYHPCFHDAFHQMHLPLPRPTGPYTVIRTTQLYSTNSALLTLGPVFDRVNDRWTNLAGYSFKDVNKTPGDTTANISKINFSSITESTWQGAQVVPSAFSVQIMNPNALQTTAGILYAGRLRTAWKMSENLGTTGAALANYFISYNNPRLMSAAKLSFRGVQVDEVPFNMSQLANFTSIEDQGTGDEVVTAATPDHSGFAPMFIYNPQGLNLQYLICCEWRVRFDPSNPAQASHVQYRHAPENFWMQALHTAEAVGNGVIDIAERVAETGNAVFNAAAGTYRASRGVRALTNGVGALALGA